MIENQAAAGSQSTVPAPAKAGAGHFQWFRSLRNILFLVILLTTGAVTVRRGGTGVQVQVAQAREAPAGLARRDGVDAGAERRLSLAHVSVTRLAYRDGPPFGFSGGFGEDHCQACHSSDKVNAAPGSLTIRTPARYAAGATYTVTVTLTRPGMAAGGFQLTARFEDDSTQAGTLALPAGHEDRMKVVTDRGVQYAYHLRPGTQLTSTDVVRWTLHWTAPAGNRTVLFHAAANAANADDTQFGDFVYTSRAQARGR